MLTTTLLGLLGLLGLALSAAISPPIATVFSPDIANPAVNITLFTTPTCTGPPAAFVSLDKDICYAFAPEIKALRVVGQDAGVRYNACPSLISFLSFSFRPCLLVLLSAVGFA